MTMIDWTLNGVFPNNYDDQVYSFYGRRGVVPNGYSPYPAGTIRATTTEVTTPGVTHLTCYAINTYRYQWETSRNGTDWSTMVGETSNELSQFYTHTPGTGGDHYYRCICKGYMGESTTAPIKIVVTYHQPTISITSDKNLITAPDTINFTATASYATSYQWKKDGVDIPGAINQAYSASFAYGDGGTYVYTCEATGLGGSVLSNAITVVVSEPVPTISISPETVTIHVGETTTLTATSTYTDSYQWYKLVDGVWSEIATATSSTYTTEAATTAGVAEYKCKATGLGGTAESNIATVTIEE